MARRNRLKPPSFTITSVSRRSPAWAPSAGPCRASETGTQMSEDAPGFELLDDTVECGQPLRQQARVVSGPEEPFGPSEQARTMFSPFHAGTSAEVLHRSLLNLEEILHDRVAAGQSIGPFGFARHNACSSLR